MSKKYTENRVRFASFIEKLHSTRSAADRDSALLLMKEVMNEVEDGFENVPAYARMQVFSFDCDWRDLEKNPCYWDDHASNRHRVYIYDDGRIVIKKLPTLREVVIDKPGSAT